MDKLYIVSGVPGSGKTMQAGLLAEAIDGSLLSWGSILRSEEFSQHAEAKKYEQGDKTAATAIMLRELSKLVEDKSIKSIVIDGFPKYMEEAAALMDFCRQNKVKIEAVISINVSLQNIAARSKRALAELQTDYYDYLESSKKALEGLRDIAVCYFCIDGDKDKQFVFAELLYKLNRKEKVGNGIYVRKSESIVPTKHGEFLIISYQSRVNYDIHLAIVKGTVYDQKSVPVRVHSSCITGDILGSLKCDCGPQLSEALDYIEKNEIGIVLYLFQEGRGINIVNKLMAYDLQRKGRDTVEANEELGLPAEMRQYEVVKDILEDLGVKSIQLLTNNPDKVTKLVEAGVNVEGRLPHEIDPIPENEKYLATKKDKMGHELHL